MDQASKKRKIFDGRYEIISIVGRGSASVVYRAKHISAPQTEVALKVLINKEDGTPNSDRLRREALAMVSSRHKHVIRLDDFHSVDKICYLAMEYAPESDLRAFAKKKGEKLPTAQIFRFMNQLAEALSFIHQAGIVHRDIKPDNILVMNERQIRLGDFGVALLPGEETSLEELKKGIGTLDYMAPEVFQGEPYLRHSDIYLFGVTFYEMLTGTHPFANVPMAKVLDARKDDALTHIKTIAPELTSQLADVVMKCLAFDPSQRFANGRELLSELSKISDPVEASETTPADSSEASPNTAQSDSKKGTEAKRPEKKKAKQKSARPEKNSKDSEGSAKDQENQQEPSKPKKRRKRRRKRKKTSSKVQTETNVTEATQAKDSKASPDRPATEIPSPVLDLNKPQNKPSQPEAREEAQKPPQETVNKPAPEPVKRPTPEPAPPEQADQQESYASAAEQVEPKKEPTSSLLSGALESGLHQDSDSETQSSSHAREFSHIPKKESVVDHSVAPKPFTKSTKRDSTHSTLRKRSPSFPFMKVGIVVLVIAVAYFFFLGGTNESPTSSGPSTGFLGSFGNSKELIPPVTEDIQAFPNLPAGMYTGLLSGIIPKIPVPLTIISEPQHKKLVVLVGIDGWQPVEVPYSAESGSTIRVKGQGYLFALTGSVQDGKISGSFKNLITQEQGQWRVQAMR